MQYVRFVSSSQVPTVNTSSSSRVVSGPAATKVLSSSSTATIGGQKILIQGRSVTVVQPQKQSVPQPKLVSVAQSTNKQIPLQKIQHQQGTSGKRIVPLETYIANNPGNAQKILAIVKSKTENLTGESKTPKITTITQSQLSQLQSTSGARNSSLVVLPKTYQNPNKTYLTTTTAIKKVEELSDSISVDEDDNQGDENENKEDNDGKF